MKLESEHAFGPRLTVSKYRLDNGLTVLLLPDRAAPVVSYQTWYRVGSRDEKPGRTGLAHLFEHLMFNQTVHLAPGEFDARIEAAGGDSNAATWVDWTFYRDNLPAAQLALAVELEADRMQSLTLTDEQVASEREVVANERRFRVEDDVEGFLGEELYKLAFTVHPYHWPTIGWMEDILSTTPAHARAFYRTFYAPNNATVVVVGEFDPGAALELIRRHYEPLPPAEVPIPSFTQEPPQRGERRAEAAKPVAADRALFGYKAPSQSNPDWLALQFVAETLAGGPSSRLHRRLVVEMEAAVSVNSQLAPFRDPGLLELHVALQRGRAAAEAEAVLDEEAQRLATIPLTGAEIEKARSRIETAFWSELEPAEGKAEALGHHETSMGDYRRLFQVPGRIRAIGSEDVQRAAGACLAREARTVVIARPLEEEAP